MGAKSGFLPFPKGFETDCIHYGHDVNQWKSKTIVPHLVLSTIFHIDNPEKPEKFIYSRMQNPTRYVLEQVMAKVNSGKAGLCFSSGMSALTSVLGIVKAGDHVLASDEMNSESFDVFTRIAKNFGISTSFANFTDPKSVCSAIRENTKLFYTENPTDPTMRIIDIQTIAEIAKIRGITFAVDNTYLTPYLQRPLELGADLVCQSVTKYINGHSDNIMGCIVMKDDKLQQQLYFTQIILGMVPAPFDCYQVLRGMKTLQIRMQDHLEKSLIVAHFLKKHPAVEKILHPGMECHPQHALFQKQASGHSGVFSFYIKGGLKESQKFVEELNYFTLSEAAGGNESTISIPSIMAHKCLTKETKNKLHITDNLIKISVGLENICDLICDLDSALGCVRN